MTTPIRRLTRNPHFLVAQIFVEVVLTLALLGVGFWVYSQSQTEHQICQVFQFVGDRTQQGIDLNSIKLRQDIKKGDKAAVALDRKAIGDATTFLIRIKKVQC